MLAGKLRVERLIGQGAMGVVYEATDITLRRRVAMKLVHPDYVGDPEKRLRFGREAYAVARLQSQHVTSVLEINELDDGTPYLVMELLEGKTLDQIIDREGPAAVDVALDWILQALDAIAEAHAIGLVHRDLKPANLYLARRANRSPIVKVLDFGLVKDMSAGAPKLTVEGSTMGSPAYMAPEQVNVEGSVDPRTDVWAIGVTLFELLTRELPFDGHTIPVLLGQIVRDDPTPLRARRPDAPAELEAVIQRCLAKDPNARYADAAELSRALVAVRAKLPTVSEATKTIRLQEGTVIPPGMSPMDMLDVSKVRPRIRAEDVPTGKRFVAAPPSPQRAMIVAAVVTTVLVSALGLAAWMFVVRRMPARPAPSAAPPPSTTAAPAPSPSVSPSPSPTPEPALPIGLELGALGAEARSAWTARATDLAACGSKASACARQVSVARTGGGKKTVVEAAPGCAVPRELSACIDGIVRKNDLPTAGEKIKLTFR